MGVVDTKLSIDKQNMVRKLFMLKYRKLNFIIIGKKGEEGEGEGEGGGGGAAAVNGLKIRKKTNKKGKLNYKKKSVKKNIKKKAKSIKNKKN